MNSFDISTEGVATLTLPYPPSVNNYYGHNPRTGRPYIKKEGREYRLKVIEILRQALPNRKPNDEKLSIWIIVNVPDRRIRDLDNINKALLDAISHSKVVWEDDYNIDDLRVRRGDLVKGGRILVYVRKITSETTTG